MCPSRGTAARCHVCRGHSHRHAVPRQRKDTARPCLRVVTLVPKVWWLFQKMRQ